MNDPIEGPYYPLAFHCVDHMSGEPDCCGDAYFRPNELFRTHEQLVVYARDLASTKRFVRLTFAPLSSGVQVRGYFLHIRIECEVTMQRPFRLESSQSRKLFPNGAVAELALTMANGTTGRARLFRRRQPHFYIAATFEPPALRAYLEGGLTEVGSLAEKNLP